jgi:hypothetical protein
MSERQAQTARGQCLCGAVSFEIDLPTHWVAHCHCTMCRRAHGAAFVTWVGVAQPQVRLHDPRQRMTRYPSSPGAERGFCGECGTPFWFRSTRWPGEIHLARAAFTTPIDRAPQAHAFFDTHVDWIVVGDDLPRRP